MLSRARLRAARGATAQGQQEALRVGTTAPAPQAGPAGAEVLVSSLHLRAFSCSSQTLLPWHFWSDFSIEDFKKTSNGESKF